MMRLENPQLRKQIAMLCLNILGTVIVGLGLFFSASFVLSTMSYGESMSIGIFLIIMGIPILLAIFGSLWGIEAFLLHCLYPAAPYRGLSRAFVITILLSPFLLMILSPKAFVPAFATSALMLIWSMFVTFLNCDKGAKRKIRPQ